MELRELMKVKFHHPEVREKVVFAGHTSTGMFMVLSMIYLVNGVQPPFISRLQNL